MNQFYRCEALAIRQTLPAVFDRVTIHRVSVLVQYSLFHLGLAKKAAGKQTHLPETEKLPDCVHTFISRYPILALRRVQTAGPQRSQLRFLHP